MTTAANFIEKYRSTLIKAGIALGIVLVLFIVWYAWASWKQGINNEGVRQQNKIIGLERAVETELSTCLDNSRVAAQVTQKEFDSVKDILVDTASARYENEGALSGDAFIQVISESYPQIDQSSWQRLMDVVVGCRKDVRDDQDRLQLDAANFKTWTESGSVFSSKIRNNFPDERLVAYDILAKQKVYGQEALEYLTRVIKTSEATEAIATGTMPDQSDDLFGEDDK